MILSDFLLAIRGFTKFTDPDVQTDALLISYLRQGEERLSADLRIADMIQIDTASLTSERTRMPDDFRSMDFLRHVDGKSCTYRPRDHFFDFESDMTTRDYTTSGMFLIVGGTISVSAPLSVELHYFGDVEPLTSEEESWVARRYPRLLIAATMEIASLGMVDPEASALWSDKATPLINKMNSDYKLSIASGSRLAPKRRSF